MDHRSIDDNVVAMFMASISEKYDNSHDSDVESPFF